MKEKETLYIVFDQLPLKASGGLVMSYANFVDAFKDIFEIKFISVFGHEPSDIEEFKNVSIIDLTDYKIDNRFYRAFSYLKQGKISIFVKALLSAAYFFAYIPIARAKTKTLLANKKVIASCPAAAIFLSKKVKFILEIHTSYDYFWGSNALGRAQSTIASNPILTIFRSNCDARKASTHFESDYIYSYFGNLKSETSVSDFKIRKNKVLFIGRLSEEKNPLFLLDCAEAIKKQIDSFCLDVYGDGELEKPLSLEIKRRNMADFVTLKGYTSDKSIYSNYSLLWLASKNEGLPLVMIEAMANKVPVVTTNWGDAVFEIVSNGVNGYIANNVSEFVEASINLLTNEEKLKSMSENAFLLYKEKFTLESYKTKWIKILSTAYHGRQ